jgi:hypothetical protein
MTADSASNIRVSERFLALRDVRGTRFTIVR